MRLSIRNHLPRTTAALLLATAVLSACGGSSMNSGSMPGNPSAPPSAAPPTMNQTPPAVAQAMDAGTPVSPALVTADNSFALDLFQNLNSGAAGNMAIAPISVAMALQILYNGAAGTTQQAMAQTLQLGAMSTQDLNNANAALQGSLMNADPNVQLTIANSLWLRLSSTPVLSSFTQMDENYYGATVGDLAGAPDDVNNWVSSETNGLITQILPSNFNPNTATSIIANVIYFKGQWTTAFDPSQTQAAPFTLAGGSSVSVQMMHETGNFPYLAGTNFQAVRLPYGTGRMSMLIVLPNSGTPLGSFVAGMTLDAMNDWIGAMQTEYGSVALPRFTATYAVSLPPALTTLGMGVAFCPDNADFSALATVPTCISDVEHKTIVEVDESGTVAAGATGIVNSPTAVMAPQFSISMDQPFIYAIRDDDSGELLFIGAMTNPTAG